MVRLFAFLMMKTIVVFLLTVSIASASLCEACIKTSEILQNSLITITPTFVAEDVVRSVCERQCT